MKIRYQMDGDQWFVSDADTFQNLAISPAGFGDTQEQALNAFVLDFAADAVKKATKKP